MLILNPPHRQHFFKKRQNVAKWLLQNKKCFYFIFFFIREKFLTRKLWMNKRYISLSYFSENICFFISSSFKKIYWPSKPCLAKLTKRCFLDMAISWPSLWLIIGMKNFLRQLKKWMNMTFHSTVTSELIKIQSSLTISDYFKKLLLSISGKNDSVD